MLRRGFSDRYGSWKTICTRLRSGRSAPDGIVAMSRPLSAPSSTEPPLGSIRRTMQRATVDLPEPDSPTMPRVWPRRISRLTSVAALHRALPAEPAACRGRSSRGRARAARTARPDRSAAPSARASAPRRSACGCRRVRGRCSTSCLVPSSTRVPRRSTATRCAMSATTPKSWVMKSTPAPWRCCRSSTSFRICACVVTSSAVVGSSAISSAGSSTSAIAITMRWRCPPDSWCG